MHDCEGCSSRPQGSTRLRPNQRCVLTWMQGLSGSRLSVGRTSRFFQWRSNPPPWQRTQGEDCSSVSDTLELFQSLGAAKLTAMASSLRREGHLTRQAIGERLSKVGQAAGFHVHPHQLRHSHTTHAVQRGVAVFTLQATLGHSSSATIADYVASNARDGSAGSAY